MKILFISAVIKECDFMLLKTTFTLFTDLGLQDDHEIVVADATTPKPISLCIKLIDSMEQT